MRGAFPLYGYGVNDDTGTGVASPQDLDYVFYGCTGRRRHDPDCPRVCRERLFVIFSKQAFFMQLLFELLERLLQGAGAGRLHVLHDQLELTPALVQADAGPGQYFLSVLQRESQVAVGAPEHRTTYL